MLQYFPKSQAWLATERVAMSLIQRQREAAGMTMTEAAKRANMSLSRFWKLEHGLLKLKVDEVAFLARALYCKPSDLIPTIEDDGEPLQEATSRA